MMMIIFIWETQIWSSSTKDEHKTNDIPDQSANLNVGMQAIIDLEYIYMYLFKN